MSTVVPLVSFTEPADVTVICECYWPKEMPQASAPWCETTRTLQRIAFTRRRLLRTLMAGVFPRALVAEEHAGDEGGRHQGKEERAALGGPRRLPPHRWHDRCVFCQEEPSGSGGQRQEMNTGLAGSRTPHAHI